MATRREKRLARQVQQNRGILADRIQHHRIVELCGHLTNDVDALGFELFEMGQGVARHEYGSVYVRGWVF